jgi:hypothetical protein
MKTPLGAIGGPPDAVAWAALGFGALALIVAIARKDALDRLVKRVPERGLVAALALAAAALSAGYIAYYLRGGPRIVDATSYWLEARALAHGHLSFHVPAPSGSFRGRFLVTAAGKTTTLAVIFPPGYPALLALGFLVHCPLAIGPLVAAGLVVTTYALARELVAHRDVALLAALLSVVCAALRYHTADTMSHGLAALLLTIALASAAHSRHATRRTAWFGALAGLACGWLVATRPVTGVVGTVLAGALAVRAARARFTFVLGLVPGLALLALHQHAATGSWFESSQIRYYALADGPPGCFRYGFGKGIGCRVEHEEFVRAHLEHGYGFVQALGTSGRRLMLHTLDIANFEPFALLVAYAMLCSRRERGLGWLTLGTLGVMLAYAPFYFDGSYPGGGARMFADVLPLEHVLLAWALVQLCAARFALPLALAGFALHASYDHRELRDREGGRPMFEPGVLARAGVDHGLVLVGTDHGFNLGFSPDVHDAFHHVLVARERDDAHDAVLWQRLGKPPAYLYHYAPFSPGARPSVTPYRPELSSTLRFEAENEWPPLAVHGGWVRPDFSSARCASGGRGLRLIATGPRVSITLEVDALVPGRYAVVTSWIGLGRPLRVQARLGSRRWDIERALDRGTCGSVTEEPVELEAGPKRLTLAARAPGAWLDYLELRLLEDNPAKSP